MWKILVFIFLLTIIFGNIAYSVWQKQVSLYENNDKVPFKEQANWSYYLGVEENYLRIGCLVNWTVTQIFFIEADVKIYNGQPIVVCLSSVLPASRASLFWLFGWNRMLFVLPMDNNRFIHRNSR